MTSMSTSIPGEQESCCVCEWGRDTGSNEQGTESVSVWVSIWRGIESCMCAIKYLKISFPDAHVSLNAVLERKEVACLVIQKWFRGIRGLFQFRKMRYEMYATCPLPLYVTIEWVCIGMSRCAYVHGRMCMNVTMLCLCPYM